MMENTVELIGFYGSDETHACSAWTSTSRDITDEKRQRIPQLLKMLAGSRPQHTTPFEKSFLHFLVTGDIASHIHIIKHRIGVSVNAESARYKELKEDKFYVPDDWPEVLQKVLTMHCNLAFDQYHLILESLVHEFGFDRKRAKESARLILPYATQITQDIAFNFHSFMHFQKLRNEEGAQGEIRRIAQQMLVLVENIEGNPFRYSLEAYGYGEDD